MFLLDTDILSLLFGGHPKVTNRSQMAADEVATSLVSRIEMLQGRFDYIQKAANEKELRRACAWLKRTEMDLSQIRIVDLDDVAAIEFERLRTNKSLKKIGRDDLLIACIALAQRATLVTRNLKDFRVVPGLKHENWAD